MLRTKRLQAGLLYALALAIPAVASQKLGTDLPSQDSRQALDKFNQDFITACQKMNHPAAAALWADDGVDLLPGMEPMVGKAKISDWLNGLTPQLAGAKMLYCTVDWKDIQIFGDIAYEWGFNRQKIEFPPPKKPFEGEGKILLILKRQGDGSWKIALESWNSNPRSQAEP